MNIGCASTRHVTDNEYLLTKVNINTDSNIDASSLKRSIYQRPNTKILGIMRLHLGFYNLSGDNTDKKLNKWLRSIGEEPVIYDNTMTDRSIAQLKLNLQNKGYYNTNITDSVWFKKKKAFITYNIKTGEPTLINNLSFTQSSNNINTNYTKAIKEISNDSINTLIEPKMPLDINILDKERERIVQYMQNNGYYNFSKQNINFYADTLNGSNSLRISTNYQPEDSLAFHKYKINQISINLEYDPLLSATNTDSIYQRIQHGNVEEIYINKNRVKLKLITETLQFTHGDTYNESIVARSYARLQALNLFKFVNIIFHEDLSNPEQAQLNCEIQLTPMKKQSYNIFTEGTNNSGNIGVGGNLTYNHKNLLRGGENLTISFYGALEKEQLQENDFFSTTEIGAEANFTTPQFWLPVFRISNFRRNNSPKTSITLVYSDEKTQFYKRHTTGASFGYIWNKNKWRYEYSLADLKYVLVPYMDENFINEFKNLYVVNAYKDHLILSTQLSAIYSKKSNSINSTYFKGNIETSGNFLSAINSLTGGTKLKTKEENYYETLGVRHAQFFKIDGEFRYNQYINKASSMAFRAFIGCGYPYGNLKVLPFEESYYSGGANDVRAWATRTLGPGSSSSNDKTTYPNSVGEFKLAANIEYRFKLIWLLEGALFLDAGNIWNINKFETREGARISNDFYKEIAVGTGLGLRLNASLFIIRLDLGMKMHDPTQKQNERFVLFNRIGGFSDPTINIAIGYPF